MNTTIAEPTFERTTATVTLSPARKRPLGRVIMHVVRRGHLYLGLFLFPWAILYSVTGFLFNHPALFADAPITSFVRSDATGTPLEDLPTPQHQAEAVLAALNARQKPATPYNSSERGPLLHTRDVRRHGEGRRSHLSRHHRPQDGQRHHP